MALAAVFLVSLSSLGYEILLTRYFSFAQWNHLSFMVISIVMFGYAASGVALSVVEQGSPGRIRSWLSPSRLPVFVLAYSAAVAASYGLLGVIPLDYFRIPLETVQAVYLLAIYVGLLVPFALAGTVVGLAFAGRPRQAGLIYGASMIGSAGGAALPALLLPLLGEGRLAVAFALLPLFVPLAAPLGAALTGRGAPGVEGRGRAGFLKFVLPSAALLALGILLVAGPAAGRLAPRPSPYKLLAQALQFPDVRITATEITLRARIDTLETPYLRFAPGLSLKYQGPLPERRLFVRDGDGLFVLMDLSDAAGLQFARYTHSFAAYELAAGSTGVPTGSVLILLQGGGLSLACAAAYGCAAATGGAAASAESAAAGRSTRLTVLVEPAPVARALRGMAVPRGIELEVRQTNLRFGLTRSLHPEGFRRLSGEAREFDVVQVEAWGPSIPGIAALSEEPLLTVEALGACLERLSPQGILSISRRLLLPPSDSVRLFATAAEALRRRGVSDPGSHILALRGWDSYTLLVSPAAFSTAQVERLRKFCVERNFDLLFYAGMPEAEANLFNKFPEAFHYRELQGLNAALREGRGERYLRGHYLDLLPSTDDRPYHNRFTRWAKLGALYRASGRRPYSLLLSGEVVILAVLGAAVLLGGALLLLPVLVARDGRRAARRGRGGRARSPRRSPPGSLPFLYFLAAGAGYLLLEMGLIQTLTVVLGSPVVALTAVLSLLLLLSGGGGALSARWSPPRLRGAALLLVGGVGGLAVLASAARAALLAGDSTASLAAAALLAALAALLAGMPFPAGLRLLVGDPAARAYAWATNGVASVLASILSLPLAMSLGISWLFAAAALCYALVAGIAFLPPRGAGARRGPGRAPCGPGRAPCGPGLTPPGTAPPA